MAPTDEALGQYIGHTHLFSHMQEPTVRFVTRRMPVL